MKNTLRSQSCHRFNSIPEVNKNLFTLLLFIGFLSISNFAHAQLPQFENFEGGFGTWIDGGSDAAWVGNTLLNGNRNVQLRDNSNVSSSIYSNPIDLTAYDSVTFDFFFYPNSMESGENFFVEYNDGSGYVVIADYVRGTDFNNNTVYNESITITSGSYTFSTNSRFRIRCDASGNGDHIYVDDINITGTLINDDCSNAIVLIPDENCIYTTSTTEGATQSLPGCTGTADDDVWFAFTAQNTEHTIEVDPTTLNDAVFQVFNSCGGTSLACRDATGGGSNESLTITGLTIGNTYYIRVYSYYSNSNQQGEFNICVTSPPPPPANDDCANAITLISNELCSVTTATTTNATQSLPGCVGTANDDVWFSFTALTSEHTIYVDPSSLYDAVIEVFDSCGGTSLACRDGSGGTQNEILTLTGLTTGNTYYIRIYSYNSNSSNQGEFNICITNSCIPSTANGTSTLGCPFVELGGVGLGSVAPPVTNCSVGETTIEATYLELGDTSSYRVESIPYSPPFQFSCLANPVSVNLDDVWSDEIILPFDFCFYDNSYSSLVIGSNGVISFDADRLKNGPSGWYTSRNIPNIVNADAFFFGPSIYGVHHDVDPSVGGEIGYQLITLDSGCQALVAAWSDVPMYNDNSILYSGMIVFYENTNIIEVYVKEKNIDSGSPWNDGNASIGLQGDRYTGIAAPGRNTLSPNWTATNEAWRFVPDGSPITELKWYEGSISAANEITDPNNDNQITVSPFSTTTYFAEVTYTLCDNSTIVEINDTTVIIEGNKTWNGSQSTAWENANNWTPIGVPTPADCITIPATANDPIMAGITDGTGYNLEIEDGAILTQQSNSSLTIEDKIIIGNNADFEIKDSASLIQITDVATNQNTGTAKVQREVTGLTNFDYVYWSTPVEPFDVSYISPSTPNYGIYEWIPTVNNGTPGKHGEWSYATGNMDLGKGYIVRDLEGTTIADNAEFEGKLNNGQITHYITRGTYNGSNYTGNGNISTAEDDNWNLMGNPYPSAISLTDFTTANPYIDGTLYFWRHTAPPSTSVDDPFYQGFYYNYSENDYLSANSLGSTPPGFNGYIAAGQGFFVQLLHTSPRPSGIIFNNSMRGVYANDGFYRTTNQNDDSDAETNSNEKHRIWLDLIDNNNTALSILVGYASGATNEIDRLFDGHLLNDTNYQFYSILNTPFNDNKLAINGRALPFEDTDTIPLGFKAPSQGQFTIALNTVDGLFEYSDQNIYLEDKELNIIHDLKANTYVFTTESGAFDERFVLRFTTQTLGVADQDIFADIDIRSINETIIATSTKSTIKTFELFDITGRVIHKKLNVEKTNYSYPTYNLSSGTYIVTVTLANGSILSKKIII